MSKVIIAILLNFFIVFATEAQIEKTRKINAYTVTLNTTDGDINGVLLQATDSIIVIEEKKGIKAIPISKIKNLKIKFATPKSYKFYSNVAQVGVDIITNSPDVVRPFSTYNDPNYISSQKQEETLEEMGGRILVGSVVTGAAVGANELTKLVYKPNIEVFKIRKDDKRYKRMKNEIKSYTLYFQQSPEYEQLQLEELKNAINTYKIKVSN